MKKLFHQVFYLYTTRWPGGGGRRGGRGKQPGQTNQGPTMVLRMRLTIASEDIDEWDVCMGGKKGKVRKEEERRGKKLTEHK